VANKCTGIAVGAESSLYIYKNFKPYYKYTVPHGGPKYTEEVTSLWQRLLMADDEYLSYLFVGIGCGNRRR